MWTQALLAILAVALPLVPGPLAASSRAFGDSFAALRKSYGDALRAYNQDPEGKPHPIRAYWPRIEAFGDQGDPQAFILLLENLGQGFDDPAETRRQGVHVFDRLLQAKLDEESELALFGKLNRQVDVLPEDLLVDIGQLGYEKGNSDQSRAQGLWMCAWARSQQGTTTDPMRRAESTELLNTILMEFPVTYAGGRAATEVFKTANQEYVDAQWAWVKSVRELQAAGRPPQDWPQLPLEKYRPSYVPLARAKLQVAMKWLRDLYPAFERARRMGNTGEGLLSVVDTLEAVYPVKSMEMAELRLAMLSVIYAQYASEPWVNMSLQHVAAMAEYYPRAGLQAMLTMLVEKSASSETRARALNMHADLLTTTSLVEDDRRAIELYERVLAEFPHTEIAKDLPGRLARLKHAMPGSPAPDTVEADEEGKDVNLAEYRGRVVLFEFHQLKDDDCIQAAPLRGALAKSMEGRPFSLIAVRVGTAIPQKLEEYHASFGVPLRSIVIDLREHAILKQWMVRKFPATYAIDADGIIRGRDLPWPEMAALVQRLVAEAEAKKPQKQ